MIIGKSVRKVIQLRFGQTRYSDEGIYTRLFQKTHQNIRQEVSRILWVNVKGSIIEDLFI